MSESQTARLLPWVSPDGKTCVLLSDGRGESGFSASRTVWKTCSSIWRTGCSITRPTC